MLKNKSAFLYWAVPPEEGDIKGSTDHTPLVLKSCGESTLMIGPNVVLLSGTACPYLVDKNGN